MTRESRTCGDLKLGAFAAPGARDADPLVLVEGPVDALALFAVGVPAVALVETRPPVWLTERTFGRRVALATEADTEGDHAAEREGDRLRNLGALSFRWRPPAGEGVKDFGDVAKPEPGGLEALRWVVVAFCEERGVPAPPGSPVAEPLPEACAWCGAPVGRFTAAGEPLCRRCFVRAVCAEA